MPGGAIAMNGPGHGRKPGVKEKEPRKKRSDVLNANREQWDAWAKQKGALATCRKMMLECVEDKNASYRDRLKAAEIIEARGYGRVAEEREQQPSQTLLIIRQSAEGYEQLNSGSGETIEGDFVVREISSE